MKQASSAQVSIEVGECLFSGLPYSHYSLTAAINQQTVSTSQQPIADGRVDFGTRLFLHFDPAAVSSIKECLLTAHALTQGGSPLTIAEGRGLIGKGQEQRVQLKVEDGSEERVEVAVRLAVSIVEPKPPKTINNRIAQIKQQPAQKQSASNSHLPPSHLSQKNLSAAPSEREQDHPKARDKSLELPKSTTSDTHQTISHNASTELERSANTTLNNQELAQQSISMQIKIDELEHRIVEMTEELKKCNDELRKTKGELTQEKKLRGSERKEKEELCQMLALEQQKNQLCTMHIAKITRLFNHCYEGQPMSLEDDEVMVQNKQLQQQLRLKDQTITDLANQLKLLQQSKLETSKRTIATKPSDDKHRVVTDRKPAQTTRKAEEQPKVAQRARDQKKQTERHPAVPRSTKEVKSPPVKPGVKSPVAKPQVKSPPTKPQVGGVRSPKVATNKGKPLKIEQKPTADSTKPSRQKSQISSVPSLAMQPSGFIEGANLLIESHEASLLKTTTQS